MPYSPHIIFTREAGEATVLARLSVERGYNVLLLLEAMGRSMKWHRH